MNRGLPSREVYEVLMDVERVSFHAKNGFIYTESKKPSTLNAEKELKMFIGDWSFALHRQSMSGKLKLKLKLKRSMHVQRA